jgi:hypothetical protein
MGGGLRTGRPIHGSFIAVGGGGGEAAPRFGDLVVTRKMGR